MTQRPPGSWVRHGDGRYLLSGLFDSYEPPRHAFRPFVAGIDILPIYGRDESGIELSETEPSAALLRYQPGAVVAPHRHTGFEHIVVLQGSQRDELGIYRRGDCIISPPGSRHSVTSDDGCLVLAIWNRPVRFDI